MRLQRTDELLDVQMRDLNRRSNRSAWSLRTGARYPQSAALARLAGLRDEGKRRARERFKLVAGDWADRAAICQVDEWRAEVDEEIRQTKAPVTRPAARRGTRREATPTEAHTRAGRFAKPTRD